MFSAVRFHQRIVVNQAIRFASKGRANKTVKYGRTIVVDGAPCKVWNITQGKRGKGGGFVKAILKNLLNGTTFERTWSSDDTVEEADTEKISATYTWSDGNNFMFMNSETYEEIAVSKEDVDQPQWLSEGQEVKLNVFNNKVFSVTLPTSCVYTVDKIDLSKNHEGYYLAIFNTGASLMVPGFIKEGDKVRINLEEETFTQRENN